MTSQQAFCAVALTLSALLCGCDANTSLLPRAQASPDDEHEREVPLAPFMAHFQRYSLKLGYSIQAKNKELAQFYLHELEENSEELQEQVEVHDGVKVAALTQAMLDPAIESLERVVDKDDWAKAETQYKTLVANCNACHQASRHGFIVITPASGTPPFNQDFSPQ